MEPVEYVFLIDVFTPDTLPMGRLAQYLSELAKLIGHHDHTHFLRVDEGSAKLVHKVDVVDAPKVHARLDGVRLGDAPKEALNAQRALEELLANDNAVATLTEVATGRIVVPFHGRNRPKPISFPPFREDTTVEGKIVSIGGKDTSAHAILQDGDIYHTSINMKRDMARQLAPLLYGPTVRLHGNGRFERLLDGVWRMTDFKVERFQKLDPTPLAEVLDAVRSVADNDLMGYEAYHRVADDLADEDEHS